jgi:hypothetical protein
MEHTEAETDVHDGLLTTEIAHKKISAKSYCTVAKVTTKVPWPRIPSTLAAPFATNFTCSVGFAVHSRFSVQWLAILEDAQPQFHSCARLETCLSNYYYR